MSGSPGPGRIPGAWGRSRRRSFEGERAVRGLWWSGSGRSGVGISRGVRGWGKPDANGAEVRTQLTADRSRRAGSQLPGGVASGEGGAISGLFLLPFSGLICFLGGGLSFPGKNVSTYVCTQCVCRLARAHVRACAAARARRPAPASITGGGGARRAGSPRCRPPAVSDLSHPRTRGSSGSGLGRSRGLGDPREALRTVCGLWRLGGACSRHRRRGLASPVPGGGCLSVRLCPQLHGRASGASQAEGRRHASRLLPLGSRLSHLPRASLGRQLPRSHPERGRRALPPEPWACASVGPSPMEFRTPFTNNQRETTEEASERAKRRQAVATPKTAVPHAVRSRPGAPAQGREWTPGETGAQAAEHVPAWGRSAGDRGVTADARGMGGPLRTWRSHGYPRWHDDLGVQAEL